KDILRIIGYIFFFISDSLLLLEYAGIEPANEIIVLSTYYLSQYAIMESSLVVGFEN
uniref:lysoplasmalogenase n=1 Tax=Meloidogyne javanica TaxID=6303 RepID=A0A915LXI2_MELJA